MQCCSAVKPPAPPPATPPVRLQLAGRRFRPWPWSALESPAGPLARWPGCGKASRPSLDSTQSAGRARRQQGGSAIDGLMTLLRTRMRWARRSEARRPPFLRHCLCVTRADKVANLFAACRILRCALLREAAEPRSGKLNAGAGNRDAGQAGGVEVTRSDTFCCARRRVTAACRGGRRRPRGSPRGSVSSRCVSSRSVRHEAYGTSRHSAHTLVSIRSGRGG